MKLSLPNADAIFTNNRCTIYKFAENDFQHVREENSALKYDEQTVTVLFEEAMFKVDSLLLERNVGYFRKYLRQQSVSSKNGNNRVVVEFNEPKKVTVGAFRVIANDFLKNKEVGLSVDKVGEILTAATFLEIPELREACHHFIGLNPGSVLLSDVGKNPKFKEMVRPNETKKPNNLLKCETCLKFFKYESQLKRHLGTHSSRRSFQCHICHKAFSQKYYIKIHLRSHTGERPFTCYICYKGFTRNETLKRHLLTHTGQKPFKCSVCHMAFAQRYSLKEHSLTHTGQKPFECPICHKAFARSTYLKLHLLIHTGQRPFKCSVCHKGFTGSGHLKEHLQTHKYEAIRMLNLSQDSHVE